MGEAENPAKIIEAIPDCREVSAQPPARGDRCATKVFPIIPLESR
jgi:hypothetical protein